MSNGQETWEELTDEQRKEEFEKLDKEFIQHFFAAKAFAKGLSLFLQPNTGVVVGVNMEDETVEKYLVAKGEDNQIFIMKSDQIGDVEEGSVVSFSNDEEPSE